MRKGKVVVIARVEVKNCLHTGKKTICLLEGNTEKIKLANRQLVIATQMYIRKKLFDKYNTPKTKTL